MMIAPQTSATPDTGYANSASSLFYYFYLVSSVFYRSINRHLGHTADMWVARMSETIYLRDLLDCNPGMPDLPRHRELSGVSE
jgi:hypothetical protein